SATRWEAKNFSSFAYPSVSRLTGAGLWTSPTPPAPGRAAEDALAGLAAAARDAFAAGLAFELTPAFAVECAFEPGAGFAAFAFELGAVLSARRDFWLAAAFFA